MEEAGETEYAPGIYVRKGGRGKGVAKASGGILGDVLTGSGVGLEPALLVEEERRLVGSVEKLEESQKALREFDPDGQDADVVEAIEENEVVISKKKERLAAVRATLDALAPCAQQERR